MIQRIPQIRIFVSSPGDVNDERQVALEVIEQLPYRPAYREKVTFRVIAWDKPGAGTPMRATLTPQDAINRGLPTPSDCDIVIVLFWSRMGTPFVHTDGVEYQSGTHWELMNALGSKRPETLIYQRTQEPPFKMSDKDFDTKHEQYKAVQTFFTSDLFYDDSGKIKRGVNRYETPNDFRKAFEIDLEVLVLDILKRLDDGATTSEDFDTEDDENITTITTQPWDNSKSPFPGLRAFTEDDADIFFGRGQEVDALIDQLSDERFVAVVGASGSGKSSLVGAGLIPRLRANAITGSKDWHIGYFTPAENPFDGVYDALIDAFPQFKPNRMEARRIKQNFIQDTLDDVRNVVGICEDGLNDDSDWAEVLFFIDQFEELFTLTEDRYKQSFIDMLTRISDHPKIRVVVTMRHDFYPKAIEYPALAKLLNTSLNLPAPKRDALRQMIELPANRADLTFEPELLTKMLDDTGDEPGNLALMAYALDELYKPDDDRILTHDEYAQLGGVQGAIGIRAENEFDKLDIEDRVLHQVFQRLVEVDERGTATRRRDDFQPDDIDEAVRDLIYAFVDARLLTTSYDVETGEAIVEVAHEAILRQWKRLADWIEATQDDHRTISRMKREARIWQEKEEPDHLLPNAETLQEFVDACERLHVRVDEPILEKFTQPEQDRLLRELEDIDVPHTRRMAIGERLDAIGDTRKGVGLREDGLPDMDWVPIKDTDGQKVEFIGDEGKFGEFEVPDFYISKYLVTYAQYQVFADSDYDNPRWWQGFPDKYQPHKLGNQRTKIANAPRDSISWYQGVAFSRWMNEQYKGMELPLDNGILLIVGDNAEIRLPTEWEWQWVAQNGDENRAYPWGDWQEGYANTSEAGLNRTTAVGMYPHGQAVFGVLDMSGNLREWCLNDYGNPEVTDGFGNEDSKVLRGGSFYFISLNARASYRDTSNPNNGYYFVGCRLVLSPILRL
jgi:formylglycine-generating enzyme required for sulfatase activity